MNEWIRFGAECYLIEDIDTSIKLKGEVFPEKNVLYTIRDFYISENNGHIYVRLNEIINPVIPFSRYKEIAFDARCFKHSSKYNLQHDLKKFIPLLLTKDESDLIND